ncbi:hypothetical protein GGH94_000825 [Coemansia aciculifera]|uniref:CRA domain-containing protein n=1 Tax=Coemansia aciculifera TaxID=417176 RepID=A0A9W8IMH9_9FUNG|nr:hypothetical protein GGH94_000825 [Coemansia aciculifera]
MSFNSDEMQARQHVTTDPVDARDLHLLVYSYLLHTNCARTASAFARTCGLATSGSLTSSSAPAYLSSPFSHSASLDTHSTEADEDQLSAAVRKGKGCMRMDDDSDRTPHPPACELSTHSNSATNSGYSSCVSIPEALPLPPRKDSAVTHATNGKEASTDARANELIAHHIEYLRIRQSICASIEAREPEVALDLLSTYFRSVLIPPPSDRLALSPLPLRQEFNATLLRFRLDIQYYVELIAKHKELDALQFGQRTLWRYTDIFDTWLNHSISLSSSTAGESLRLHYSSSQPVSESPSYQQSLAGDGEVVTRVELKQKRAEIMRHITNVAALVAYPDPRQSPLAYLLTQERREELAAAVNAAILQTMQFPREPALVALVRQLATTSAYLVGYRSSSSSRSAAVKKDTLQQQQQQQQQPWVLDAFVNSDADTFV